MIVTSVPAHCRRAAALELQTPQPSRGGRPRKHANEAERARDYRKRKRRHETSSVTADDGRDRDETGFVTPPTPTFYHSMSGGISMRDAQRKISKRIVSLFAASLDLISLRSDGTHRLSRK
jgi:hypothetical protein